MERIQGPHLITGREVRAELERTQTELAATRRNIQELEQLVAAKTAEAAKWEARTRKQPRPLSENRRLALVVGVALGVLLAQGFIVWKGGRMPPGTPSFEIKPEFSVPMP
jgi:ferric-dicitrate binding protein FerR (iron transport regulator)